MLLLAIDLLVYDTLPDRVLHRSNVWSGIGLHNDIDLVAWCIVRKRGRRVLSQNQGRCVEWMERSSREFKRKER